ncbi:peroxiredoxin [Prevotella sp. 10(H)]|uniref:peroxiredoxin family protein n=1 Tax=Prevotella sp. 10(H) TaxID=1158294 RepID=UPI0026F3F267|nr:redoxin domain-containing protein [Prevotella sp. 10(H)]
MNKGKFISMYTLLALLSFISCNNQKESVYADIKNLGNDTVFVEYRRLSEKENQEYIKDTVIANDGKFSYNFPIEGKYIVAFSPSKLIKTGYSGHKYSSDRLSIIQFVNTSEKIKIEGEIEKDYIDYHISGSDIGKDYAETRNKNKTTGLTIDSLEIAIEYYTHGPGGKDTPQDSLIQVLFDIRNKKNNEIRAEELNFIKNNPDSELSGYYLINQPLDSVDIYYKTLSEPAINGFFKPLLEKRIQQSREYIAIKENKKKIIEGKEAPDFILKDMEGKDVQLSDFQGKYVVLDFWGSWCGWCIHGFPRMKEYYNKYKNKAEFIGIDCYDKESDWKKAVIDNQLNWTQLINADTKDMEKNVIVLYGIEAYPTKIIIDKNRIIQAVVRGESDDFYKKLDEILR